MWGGFKNSQKKRQYERRGVERGRVSGSTLTNGSAELAGAPGSTDS